MSCPHCRSCHIRKLSVTTDLGYSRFQCRSCRRTFNERTGTPFNFLEMPTDIVFQVVLFRLLFKLSLRDLIQMFLIRGYELSHETIRDWEAWFASLLADHVRRRRKGQISRCWHVDETYLKVSGRWCYLYRAIDRQGQLIDSMLSAKRDRAAAQRFFRSAQAVTERRPEQVTTDGHNAYSRAIAEVLGKLEKGTISYESGCLTISLPGSNVNTLLGSGLVLPRNSCDAIPSEPVLTDPENSGTATFRSCSN